jgi:hypothetical protein
MLALMLTIIQPMLIQVVFIRLKPHLMQLHGLLLLLLIRDHAVKLLQISFFWLVKMELQELLQLELGVLLLVQPPISLH